MGGTKTTMQILVSGMVRQSDQIGNKRATINRGDDHGMKH